METIMLRTRKATRREIKKFDSGVAFGTYNTDDVHVYCKAVHNTHTCWRLKMRLTREQYMQMRTEGIIDMEVPMMVYCRTGKNSELAFKNEAVRIRSNITTNMYRRRFFAILDDMLDVESSSYSTHSFGIVEFEFSNAVLDM